MLVWFNPIKSSVTKTWPSQYTDEPIPIVGIFNFWVMSFAISDFTHSKTLFINGTKFIVLDEVDYMTKNAQQALKILINKTIHKNIRFCLICNYITKIILPLQN